MVGFLCFLFVPLHGYMHGNQYRSRNIDISRIKEDYRRLWTLSLEKTKLRAIGTAQPEVEQPNRVPALEEWIASEQSETHARHVTR